MPATLPKFDGGIAGRHLGRRKPTAEMRRRALPLAPFIKRMGAKPPPDDIDYTLKGQRTLSQMLGNDQVGDCTIAAVLHQGGVHTAEQPGGAERVPTTQEALSQYQSICGPGDQGCYIPDVLDAWRDRGISVGGKSVKADGYVSLALGDELLAKVAAYLFGPLHFGINLPNDWYVNASPGFVWGVTTSRIVGGHSIAVPGYTRQGFRVSTWGTMGVMTFEAFHRPEWVEESYAVLTPDWYDKDGLDEHGVNVSALKDALAAIKAGGTPEIPDGPTPPPPTPPTPPEPGGPHELSYVFELFGYTLRIYAGYEIGSAMRWTRKVDYWHLLRDVSAFGKAFEAKDWPGVWSAGLAILADLGIGISLDRLEAWVRGLRASEETKVLTEKVPPTDQSKMESESDWR